MTIPHGNNSGYSWHKCRCDVCVTAKRTRDRTYYEQKSEEIKARTAAFHQENREEILVKRRAKVASRSELEREADRQKRQDYLAGEEARMKLRAPPVSLQQNGRRSRVGPSPIAHAPRCAPHPRGH